MIPHLKSSILGYKKRLDNRASLLQRSLPLLNKIFVKVYNMDSPQDLPTQHSDPFPGFKKKKTNGTPVHPVHLFQTHAKPPNPQTLSPSPVVATKPEIHVEWPKPLHWAVTLKKCFIKFFSDTWNFPRRGVGMDSFPWTVEIVRWTRWFLGGLMIFHRKVTRPNLILYWGFWLDI